MRLATLANNFTRGATALEGRFDSSDFDSAAFAAISLYADWEEYCRRLVYVSAARNPSASDGRVITRAPGIRTYRDVDGELKRHKGRRKNQPLVLHLGAPRAMVDVCKQLKLTNEQVITAAITSQNSPANDLRLVRNFLAHQNPSTASQVKAGPRGSALEVRTLVSWLAQKQAGGRSRFGVWVGDLAAVSRACTD